VSAGKNAERHQQIGQLFHAALELPDQSRSSFLDEACGGDAGLRHQVESLLRADQEAGGFIATPAIDLLASAIAHQPDAGPLRTRIGAYDVLSLIGRGGMGEVYLAQDARLGRRVAVKLLRSDLTSHPEAVRRFEQEARAASSLNHPNIVTIYEIGDSDSRRYLAMEFVDGRALNTMIGEPVGVNVIGQIGAQLARALSVAHAAAIVHRDIKPENIMVREDGYVKVLDFGVARLLPAPGTAWPHGSIDGTGTSPGLILGTPRYMSPEQARGETALSASDVFSLGVVLYELATGTHPFESESTLGTLHAITTRAAPEPGTIRGESAVLERMLLRMLQKEAAARPTADEVEAELTTLTAAASRRIPQTPSAGGHPRLGSVPRGVPGDVVAGVASSASGNVSVGVSSKVSAGVSIGHNLPAQRTTLIGRTGELANVQRLLLDPGIRLLTLTGAGGTGKTRLAVQAAADVLDPFEGGVWFVDLAPIADPRLVASAVALSVGVRESDYPLVTSIVDHLRNRGPTLLLMDNFEQVSGAAALVRDLLDACHALKILVTSRVVLHIYGEQEFPVPPLPLPALDAVPAPAALMECASIALFVQRAAAGRPDFTLTSRNADAVVDICRRLDGLPLAIELAAARVKILPPAELLARIERRLELLTGGARDLPERQQTLRGTIKWSFDLLTPAEQMLFRRLSVFAGGCTLEGIEAVCNTGEDLGIDVLNGVTSLIDNSLLVQRLADDAEPRFVMLETFREYGRERLLESGEVTATGRAHAAYMLVLAEEGTLEMNPAQLAAWLRCCAAEHDNFRAAIHHLVTTGDAEWALQLGGALFRFWEQRDHVTEGWEALAGVLALPGAEVPTRARARALYGATVFADIRGDWDTAAALSREACDIYLQLDDIKGVASTLTALALQAQRQGRYAEATAVSSEAVRLWQQLGDSTAVDLARSNMANAARAGGDFDLARGLFEQVAEAFQARGDVRGVASALNGLGDVAAAQGDHDSARRHHHQSLAGYRQIDDRWGIARVLSDLAAIDLQAGVYAAANGSLREALRAFRALGHQRGVARQLESLSRCASGQGRVEASVVLAGAAAALRQKIGIPAKQAELAQLDGALTAARTHLSADAYASAWRDGRTGTLDWILEIRTVPKG
jgi:predicted ATPase/serine/threonine protein kinase